MIPDKELLPLLYQDSLIVRPNTDSSLTNDRDVHGFCVVDPAHGHRFYEKNAGDPTGASRRKHFYLRDGGGRVVRWGTTRRHLVRKPDVPLGLQPLLIFVQALYSGPGTAQELDPRLHDLGRIATLLVASLGIPNFASLKAGFSSAPRANEIIIIDERRHWFDRKRTQS